MATTYIFLPEGKPYEHKKLSEIMKRVAGEGYSFYSGQIDQSSRAGGAVWEVSATVIELSGKEDFVDTVVKPLMEALDRKSFTTVPLNSTRYTVNGQWPDRMNASASPVMYRID